LKWLKDKLHFMLGSFLFAGEILGGVAAGNVGDKAVKPAPEGCTHAANWQMRARSFYV
jgi:hypothetical protein